jgi:signal transduction histidine kinase
MKNMKTNGFPLQLVLVLTVLTLLATPATSRAQAPDLSKISAYPDKVRTWVDYCESLRLNSAGVKNNYVLLQQAGLQGLQWAKPDDHDGRAKFFMYAALGNYYQIRFDSAQYYFYQTLREAQKGHNAGLITRACVALIPVNFQLQQQDKVEECKNILQSVLDTTRNHDILENGDFALGNYYQLKSYYSTAQDYFIKSIELRETEVDTTADIKKKFDFAIQCDMLSKLYLNTQMADKSLDALRKAQRFSSVSPSAGNRLLSSFVEAFTTSGNIDSALYYDRQLEKSVPNPMLFPSEIVSSDLNIAIYYLDHKAYQNALPYVTKGDTLAARTQAPLLIFQAQMIKGRFLEETGKFDAAIALLTQALPVAKQFSKELYGNTLKSMALAQKGKGNAAAALSYYQQYVETTDSLTKEKISRTFADLETHYQTNEKIQRIASLDKENRLHVLELENASRTRLLLVLGLAALGVISLLLYFIYRNKEKLNRVLNERNDQLDDLNHRLEAANDTKARLFGIISHDLRSPVAKIVSLLQLQKARPDLLNEEARKKHDERLKIASENVLETMEDLLLWSKSQMQHFTLSLKPVLIADVLQKEINLLQEHLPEEDIRIVSRVPSSFVRQTDENFLSVIVRNLLMNAVKYGDGDSAISISADGSSLHISNHSASANLAVLNERLASGQIDSGSSGLGLQIVRDLADAIGAKVYFRQQEQMLTAVLDFEGGD